MAIGNDLGKRDGGGGSARPRRRVRRHVDLREQGRALRRHALPGVHARAVRRHLPRRRDEGARLRRQGRPRRQEQVREGRH